MIRRLPRLLALPLALAALSGCLGSTAANSAPTLTVLAAASLTGVLDPLTADLAAAHPGLTVRFVYAGSPTLVAQVRSGAPADVLITASESSLAPLVRADLVGPPTTIARNAVVLIVPATNPGRVESLRDLADVRLRIALCDPAVPCGAAAQASLAAAGVRAAPDTLAPDVKTVLRLVSTREADAGIVYATDAREAGRQVRVLPLPPGTAASTSYPAAVLTSSSRAELAREYVALLAGPRGQAALRAAGFSPP